MSPVSKTRTGKLRHLLASPNSAFQKLASPRGGKQRGEEAEGCGKMGNVEPERKSSLVMQ